MHIAQIAPPHYRVPPLKVGGIERVVGYLTDALVLKGHHVTLFASADSETSADLVPSCERHLAATGTHLELPTYLHTIEMAIDRLNCFDVVHNHIDYLILPYIRGLSKPILSTYHNALPSEWFAYLHKHGYHPSVSITDWQQRQFPPMNWLGTVYDGLPKDLYAPTYSSEEYLVFIGRLSPVKGLHHAIVIATMLKIKLVVAGNITDHKYSEALLIDAKQNPYVTYVGEINHQEKQKLLSSAKWLIYPSAKEDPFAMVIIEALACGTPVIAFRDSCAAELITHGESGCLLESVNDFRKILSLSPDNMRSSARSAFEERFTAEAMVDRYLELYETCI